MEVFDWLAVHSVMQLAAIESVHVASYSVELTKHSSASTAKLRLAALRRLFDWMVVGQIMPTNPAAAVRARAISCGAQDAGARSGRGAPAYRRDRRHNRDRFADRVLIGLMLNSFARIGAVIGMKVEDL